MEINKSKNKNGELVITGIDSLKLLLANAESYKPFEFDPYDDGQIYKIKNVNENGIEAENSKFFPWEKIYFTNDGLMINYKSFKNYFYFQLTEEEKQKHPYDNHLEKMADLQDKLNDYEDSLMENKNNKDMSIKNFINEEVSKLHKKFVLESKLSEINKELKILKEGEEELEQKDYQRNVYESYEKDLEEVVKYLTEACNKLESASLKQDKHMSMLPEVAERMEEAKKQKEILLNIYKEIKGAKLATERKLYEMK
jgi:DNA repair exonuclease SbcCD ATPase subunit